MGRIITVLLLVILLSGCVQPKKTRPTTTTVEEGPQTELVHPKQYTVLASSGGGSSGHSSHLSCEMSVTNNIIISAKGAGSFSDHTTKRNYTLSFDGKDTRCSCHHMYWSNKSVTDRCVNCDMAFCRQNLYVPKWVFENAQAEKIGLSDSCGKIKDIYNNDWLVCFFEGELVGKASAHGTSWMRLDLFPRACESKAVAITALGNMCLDRYLEYGRGEKMAMGICKRAAERDRGFADICYERIAERLGSDAACAAILADWRRDRCVRGLSNS